MPKSSSKEKAAPKSDGDVLDQLRKLAKKQKKKRHADKKKEPPMNTAMMPMTKEVYEKKRSTITTEYDAQTGRMRRKRATGEILETIVTREQHLKINKMSTLMDGISYQNQVIKK